MTLQKIHRFCDTAEWEKFCKEKGYNVDSVKKRDGDIEVELSLEEARYFGITKIPGID